MEERYTDIRLVKVPIEIDNKNQLTFSSKTTQYNYFNSCTHIELDDGSYQRKDSIVRYPGHIDDLIGYNYCMYRNTGYSNKWYYAFITDMQYSSDSMTIVSIKTDVWQTWCFDIDIKQCFVEREHVNDDTPGLHTVPEGIVTGDYVGTTLQPAQKGNYETCFVLSATELLGEYTYSTSNQKIPSGFYYLGFTSVVGLDNMIKAYDKAGKADSIVSVFVSYKSFFSSWIHNKTITVDNETFTIAEDISYTVDFDKEETVTITKVDYLDNNYVPVNKKLLCFPYSFLQVSNHNGTIVNYNWEEFNKLLNGTDYEFKIKCTITPGGSASCYPLDYKNILENYDECINMGKLPIGGWSSDVYTNWLTQNGINILGTHIDATTYRIGKGAIQTVVGAGQLMGGDVSGSMNVAGGVGDIFNALQDDYRHSLIPDQAGGNLNIGDYSFQFGLTNFEFKRISIKREYARICDGFFSMFGYKVSTTKIPNITGRTNWNYVKTIDCNIHGYIPQKDCIEIKNMFNAGVTFWHNPSTFLDYSQSNAIVS